MSMLRVLVAIALVAPSFLAQGEQPSTANPQGQSANQEQPDETPKPRVQPEELPPMVVTATLFEAEGYDIAQGVHVVPDDNLSIRRTLQDAIADLPGVHLQRTSYGQTSPFLRGFTGYHTLLLVDGIRLNNSVLRAGPNEYWGLVDPYSLERLELVLGPGSVLHGSDAVGGTVNAIPLRRKEYSEGYSWNGRLVGRTSTAEASFLGRAQFEGNVGTDMGYLIGITGADFGDLRAGGDVGRQPMTGYGTWYGDARFDIFIDDNWSIAVQGQVGRVNDVNRVHRTIFGTEFDGAGIGSDLQRRFDWYRDLAAVTLRGEDLDAFADEVLFRVSYQGIEERQERIRQPADPDANVTGRRTVSGFNVATLGVALQLVSELPLGRLTYGVDYYRRLG